MESHLLQMRGLKHVNMSVALILSVASFTDAWIETLPAHRSCKNHPVASFTDAWIETPDTIRLYAPGKSHLLQMRGLKLTFIRTNRAKKSRIFYRCVDWNILVWIGNIIGISRIFYRCVDWNVKQMLKLISPKSHLLQMRGLKLRNATRRRKPISRIFYRCVDWNCYS